MAKQTQWIEGDLIFDASITCEACNHAYNLTSTVHNYRYERQGWLVTREEMEMGWKAACDTQLIYFKQKPSLLNTKLPCPNCGYIQSWMISAAQKEISPLLDNSAWVLNGLAQLMVGGALLVGFFSQVWKFSGLFGNITFYIIVGVVGFIFAGIAEAINKNIENRRQQFNPNNMWMEKKSLSDGQKPTPRIPEIQMTIKRK